MTNDMEKRADDANAGPPLSVSTQPSTPVVTEIAHHMRPSSLLRRSATTRAEQPLLRCNLDT